MKNFQTSEEKTKISEEEIIDHFKSAIRTIERLPSVKIQGYFSIWPEIKYSAIEILRMDQKMRKWQPTAEQISKMEKTCSWINFLEEADDRKIVWMRARRISWQEICGCFGFSRTTANNRWKSAIAKICQKLNEENS